MDCTTRLKFSRHYVFPSIRFGCLREMKTFVQRMIQQLPKRFQSFFDDSVYAEGRLFRTQGSRKNAHGTNVMGGKLYKNFSSWEKTLICTVDSANKREKIHHMYIKNEQCVRIPVQRGSKNEAHVRSVKEDTRYFVFFFSHNHNCKIAGRTHSSNNIFIRFDKELKRWEQLCFSPKCRNQSKILDPSSVSPQMIQIVT